MKVIGVKIVNNGIEVPIVVECTSIEVGGISIDDKALDPDYCTLYMRSAHPSLMFYIIKSEKRKNGCYYLLNKAEANEIIKCASQSDVIDLQKFGNYQIRCERQIQAVMVMNAYDENEFKEVPIIIKLEDDKDE